MRRTILAIVSMTFLTGGAAFALPMGNTVSVREQSSELILQAKSKKPKKAEKKSKGTKGMQMNMPPGHKM